MHTTPTLPATSTTTDDGRVSIGQKFGRTMTDEELRARLAALPVVPIRCICTAPFCPADH